MDNTISKEYFDESIERVIQKLSLLENHIKSQDDCKIITDQLLDNQDVCQLLKISKSTLQRYRRLKKIKYQLIGKKCYYQKEDIQVFIDTYHEQFGRI